MIEFARERHWIWLIWLTTKNQKPNEKELVGVFYIRASAQVWTVDVRTADLSAVDLRKISAKLDALNSDYDGVLRFPESKYQDELKKLRLKSKLLDLDDANLDSRDMSCSLIRERALMDELDDTDADLDHLEEALRIRELVHGQVSTDDVLDLIREIRADERGRREDYSTFYINKAPIPNVDWLHKLIPDEDEDDE